MSWITVTESLVQTRAAGSEFDALKTSALPDGMTGAEMLAEVIAQTVDVVRGYCATAVRNGHLKKMGDTGTVPSRLLKTTLNVIRYELITRLPGLGKRLLDEARQKQQDADTTLLEQVANGKFSVEDPDDAETSVSGPGIEVVSSTDRARKPSQTAGL